MQLFHFSATVAVATAAATALFAATVNAASNNNPFWFQIFIQNMPPSSGVNSTQIPAFQALNGNSSIIVSWETNTCAPAQNQVSPCNFGSGNKPKPSDIFPKGFDGFGVMSATNSNFSLDLSKDCKGGGILTRGDDVKWRLIFLCSQHPPPQQTMVPSLKMVKIQACIGSQIWLDFRQITTSSTCMLKTHLAMLSKDNQ